MIILGVDNAGKTTMLEQLKKTFGAKSMPIDKIPPTIGLNIGKVTIDGVTAVFWDIGGHISLRSIWHSYYSEVEGIIFVIDSADAGRMDEAKTVLDGLMAHEALQSVPLLCMANKQEIKDALGIEELSRIFTLEDKQGS